MANDPPTDINSIANGTDTVHQAENYIMSAEDTTVTKVEKRERNGNLSDHEGLNVESKRPKLEKTEALATEPPTNTRKKGVAPIKSEYLVTGQLNGRNDRATTRAATEGDDEAEGAAHHAPPSKGAEKRKKHKGGQNTNRDYGSSKDEKPLCSTRMMANELSPPDCQYGSSCRFEHDLRTYLTTGKREDLSTFDGVCPVYKARQKCDAGWKCRWLSSHMEERETTGGRKELVLLSAEPSNMDAQQENVSSIRGLASNGSVNEVSIEAKSKLTKKKFETPLADKFSAWIQKSGEQDQQRQERGRTGEANDDTSENRAQYIEPPFLPSEKRRIYFGPETPALAPLTTQGNLPFRRMCVDFGAQATYSEMAMSMSLLQGSKSEWALLRAHASEAMPPTVSQERASVVQGYKHDGDLKFGAQIAGNKAWQVLKATEVLTTLCPHLRVVDLNCGCPIDLVFRQGAGSALLDHPGKLEKMLQGMNAVSGSVPISVKIRTGTKDHKPTALRLVDRLVYGTSPEYFPPSSSAEEDAAMNAAPFTFKGKPSGVAAITLHGRTRQQRYTRDADWEYISSVAALIKTHKANGDRVSDTANEPDARDQANHASSSTSSSPSAVYFLGNGDCYSPEDYTRHMSSIPGLSSIMLGRGALIKPWIFEEIQANQALDVPATVRLGYIERFVRYGLEHWGSDEYGVGTTRRFLLEWLSFAHRYLPLGLLEVTPPRMQDRPPRWKGRNELETLLGSEDCRDWIKISEMFLGPATKDFKFLPKHRSNAYEIDAEG